EAMLGEQRRREYDGRFTVPLGPEREGLACGLFRTQVVALIGGLASALHVECGEMRTIRRTLGVSLSARFVERDVGRTHLQLRGVRRDGLRARLALHRIEAPHLSPRAAPH